MQLHKIFDPDNFSFIILKSSFGDLKLFINFSFHFQLNVEKKINLNYLEHSYLIFLENFAAKNVPSTKNFRYNETINEKFILTNKRKLLNLGKFYLK